MTMFRHGGALRGLGGRSYVKRIGAIFGSSIVAFWPQNESAGTVSKDISGHAYNGAYTGITLGAQGIGDGNTAASFDGTTSFNNVYSAGLAAAFNAAEGTIIAWAKVSGAGVWADGVDRRIITIQADANNRVLIHKQTDNTMEWRYVAGGTLKAVSLATTPVVFMSVAITWSVSSDALIAYINGVKTGSTQTTLGTWSGALTSTTCCIGSVSTAPTLVWSGPIGPVLLLNRAATAAEIALAATV